MTEDEIEDLRGQIRAALLAICDDRVIDLLPIATGLTVDDVVMYPKGRFDSEEPREAFRLGDILDAVMDVLEPRR